MFKESYDLTQLKPATYNPRKIDDEAFNKLKESLRTLGIVKPIIINFNNIIIAGHQRTRAALSEGITHGPVFQIDVPLSDEARFNQLHNGTDFDNDTTQTTVTLDNVKYGFQEISFKAINLDKPSDNANIKKEICRLMDRYGNWGAAIVDDSGNVINGSIYLECCKLLRRDARVFVTTKDLSATLKQIFGESYGKFNYDNIPKQTYAQSFAQPRRRIESTEVERQNNSYLYEQMAMPKMTTDQRWLDFGCGQRDYVDFLKKKGFNIHGMEFFYRTGNSLNLTEVHKMCDNLENELTTNGLFDSTICEFVVNSTDSAQAEEDVLVCANAFTKQGGLVFLSGRLLETVEYRNNSVKATDRKYNLYYLDENNRSAVLSRGIWLYQKFHSKEECKALFRKYIGVPHEVRYEWSNWFICGRKIVTLPEEMIESALTREFNLTLPNDATLNRHEGIVDAFRRRNKTGDIAV